MAGRPTFVLYTFVNFVYSIFLHFPFCYSYISTFVRSYISFNPPSSLSFLYIRTFLLLDCALFVLSYMSACLLAHSYIRFRTFVALELGNQWRKPNSQARRGCPGPKSTKARDLKSFAPRLRVKVSGALPRNLHPQPSARNAVAHSGLNHRERALRRSVTHEHPKTPLNTKPLNR